MVKRGTGTAAAIGRPVLGKTGTTQNNIDAWFSGATPDLATAVWVGYPRPKPMARVHGRPVTGGSFPAQVFSDVMRSALKGVPAHGIHTASPDALGLHKAGAEDAPAAGDESPTTLTTETTLVEETPTTDVTISDGTTDTTSTPRTTRPPRTTTTTAKKSSATTTTTQPSAQDKSRPKEASTPSTTAPSGGG